MFILGCDRLSVSTDHKPLLGILGDRDLGSITNPRILSMKQRTMPFRFTIKYNPGKWHRGPDALSRSPVLAIITHTPSGTNNDLITLEDQTNAHICSVFNTMETETSVQISDILRETDEEYRLVVKSTIEGFPNTQNVSILFIYLYLPL